jgi:hypothetical protein
MTIVCGLDLYDVCYHEVGKTIEKLQKVQG